MVKHGTAISIDLGDGTIVAGLVFDTSPLTEHRNDEGLPWVTAVYLDPGKNPKSSLRGDPKDSVVTLHALAPQDGCGRGYIVLAEGVAIAQELDAQLVRQCDEAQRQAKALNEENEHLRKQFTDQEVEISNLKTELDTLKHQDGQ